MDRKTAIEKLKKEVSALQRRIDREEKEFEKEKCKGPWVPDPDRGDEFFLLDLNTEKIEEADELPRNFLRMPRHFDNKTNALIAKDAHRKLALSLNFAVQAGGDGVHHSEGPAQFVLGASCVLPAYKATYQGLVHFPDMESAWKCYRYLKSADLLR